MKKLFLLSILFFTFSFSNMFAISDSYTQIAKDNNIAVPRIVYKTDRFEVYYDNASNFYEKWEYAEAKKELDTYLKYVFFPECDVFQTQINILEWLGDTQAVKEYNLRKTLCENYYPEDVLSEYISNIEDSGLDEYLYLSKRFYYLRKNWELYDDGRFQESINFLYNDVMYFPLYHFGDEDKFPDPFTVERFQTLIEEDYMEKPLLLMYIAQQYYENNDTQKALELYNEILSHENIVFLFQSHHETPYNSSHERAYQRLALYSTDVWEKVFYSLASLNTLDGLDELSNNDIQNFKANRASLAHSSIQNVLYTEKWVIKKFLNLIEYELWSDINSFLVTLTGLDSSDTSEISNMLQQWEENNFSEIWYDEKLIIDMFEQSERTEKICNAINAAIKETWLLWDYVCISKEVIADTNDEVVKENAVENTSVSVENSDLKAAKTPFFQDIDKSKVIVIIQIFIFLSIICFIIFFILKHKK